VLAERFGVALLAGALVSTLARESSAFCRSTTCDVAHEQCAVDDATGCVLEGAPLHWESGCLSFGVQRDGSPLRHITFEVADEIIQTAFQQWMGATCEGGGHPSFRVWDLGRKYGGIICDEPEFNAIKPNANVWIFRDKDWPYEGDTSTLALTSTIFEKTSGALLDADVEINSYKIVLTTTGVSSDVEKDLQSIVTHEAGHFLGLGHSPLSTATMYKMYSPGDLNYRSLAVDDQQGICSIYPPDRDAPACVAPSPAHGFSLYCGGGGDEGTASATGCAVGPQAPRDTSFAVVSAALAANVLCARRRRRRAITG
jgi:hypothetical protein